MLNWVFWAPLGAASLHIIEEFVYPGGFAAWDRRYRSGIRKSITPRFHIIINGLLLVACYDVAVLGETPVGNAVWLTVAALLFSNAAWHVVGAVKTRSYSPGIFSGLFVYVPLAVYGYARFLHSGQAAILTAIIAFAVGASYQFWATAVHKLRTRRVQT